MATTLIIPVSPGEKFGVSLDYSKQMSADATITSLHEVPETLLGTLAIEHTPPSVDPTDPQKAIITLTIPADSEGSRWRVTVDATTSEDTILHQAVEAVCG